MVNSTCSAWKLFGGHKGKTHSWAVPSQKQGKKKHRCVQKIPKLSFLVIGKCGPGKLAICEYNTQAWWSLQKRDWWFCQQLCSSLIIPFLPFQGSATAPCLVPCVVAASGTAVWLCMGLGTTASWSHHVFSVSFIKTTWCPADLCSYQSSAQTLFSYCCIPLSSAWGDPSAGAPVPMSGWRAAEC